MDDSSSLRYQHRRNILRRQIRESEAVAEAAREMLRELDAAGEPANETLQQQIVRLVTREAAARILDEMNRRITWAQIGRRALEAELRAIWSM